MLSILKQLLIGLGSTASLILILTAGALGNDVLDFYRDRAAAVTRSHHPLEHGISFSFSIRSTLNRIERGGDAIPVDSAIVSYFVSFGELDSMRVRVATDDALSDFDISYPNVFEHDYDFNFFPNDTGGAVLSIGFDADSSRGALPSGLAVIDRDQYFLKRLYLHYPNEKRYKRRSKEIEFTKHEGLVFPKRIKENFVRAGILSVEYFRLVTTVYDIKIISR